MKTLIPGFALWTSLLLISSCGLFDDLKEISFDADLPVEFFIDENESNPTGKSYSEEQLLDLTADPDISEYASKIRDVKVNSVSYRIYNVDGDGVQFSGGSLVTKSNNKTIATVTNVSVSEFVNGDFVIDATGFSELSTRLKNNKSETIRLQGTLSETPISFRVEITFNVTITAEVL